jgi:hypothetical protein
VRIVEENRFLFVSGVSIQAQPAVAILPSYFARSGFIVAPGKKSFRAMEQVIQREFMDLIRAVAE